MVKNQAAILVDKEINTVLSQEVAFMETFEYNQVPSYQISL